MSKSIGIIKKASFYLSKSTLLTLYYSLVYPYMQYCILVWGSMYPSNLRRIVLLQKRVVRIINKAVYDAHTEPMFNDLGLLPFQKIYLFHLGNLCFCSTKECYRLILIIFFVVLIKFIIIIHVIRNCIMSLSVELILSSSPLFIKV